MFAFFKRVIVLDRPIHGGAGSLPVQIGSSITTSSFVNPVRSVSGSHAQAISKIEPSGKPTPQICAIFSPDPVIVFEPKEIYRAFREEVPEEPETLPIGKGRVARPGTDANPSGALKYAHNAPSVVWLLLGQSMSSAGGTWLGGRGFQRLAIG